jgi:hypothetical protein
VVLLLEKNLVSWSLVMDERGGHKDLRGSGHRSVIPYVHGRNEVYCSSMACLCEPESCLSFRPSADPFLVHQMLKWFYDTSTAASTGAARCGSFIGGGFGLLVTSYG